MTSIAINLTTYPSYFYKFCEWYKIKNLKIDLKTFLSLDFEYQLGHLLFFLNENNIHILTGNDFYLVYAITSIDTLRRKTITIVEDKDHDKSLVDIYREVILKSFEHLTNPF